MGTVGVIETDMDKKWKRYNLYVPEEDGEEILRKARYAAADARLRLNAWIFSTLRKELGIKEPKLKKEKGNKK